MKILHICDGWERWNGAANIARMIAGEQQAAGHQVELNRYAKLSELRSADEVWIHCGWKPCLWWAALWAKKAYWMPEACYDPVRLNFHGWKKRLVGPVERFCLRRCERLMATCEAEREWIKQYLGKRCPEIEVQNIKRFFKLEHSSRTLQASKPPTFQPSNPPLHLLYMGRRHPLKGVEFLVEAAKDLNGNEVKMVDESWGQRVEGKKVELRIVSNAFGEEKEALWQWCDVFCLPTLSDNLGLVIAEALEHGKQVIATDGAPAWNEGDCVVYLKGFRDGTREERVRLLKNAIEEMMKVAV